MQRLTILGSTGTIGQQALQIVSYHPDRFSVFALAAAKNAALLFEQCQRFHPRYAILTDNSAATELMDRLRAVQSKTEVLIGESSLCDVVSSSQTDTVLSAIVGAAALLPTMAAIKAGKRVLLANKEALIMAGELMMSAVRDYEATLLPIDSEHSAVFQALPQGFLPGQKKPSNLSSIALTASGGPFRLTPLDQLSQVTPEHAVAHPNWRMGPKISVDSATMMNKGLEVIEAKWLFDLSPNEIDVIIHPQSLFHAFVHYLDGTTLAQMAMPDMRVPIAYSLSWPDRIETGVSKIDFNLLASSEFFPPEMSRYPCLKLAFQALEAGSAATILLNAANEVAVASFLSRKIRFDQISEVVESVLMESTTLKPDSVEVVRAIDAQGRKCAMDNIDQLIGLTRYCS